VLVLVLVRITESALRVAFVPTLELALVKPLGDAVPLDTDVGV
jgi:hypothetical protein